MDSSGGFSAGEVIDDTGAAMKFDSQEYYPYVYCRIAADIIDSIWDLSLHYSFTRPGFINLCVCGHSVDTILMKLNPH